MLTHIWLRKRGLGDGDGGGDGGGSSGDGGSSSGDGGSSSGDGGSSASAAAAAAAADSAAADSAAADSAAADSAAADSAAADSAAADSAAADSAAADSAAADASIAAMGFDTGIAPDDSTAMGFDTSIAPDDAVAQSNADGVGRSGTRTQSVTYKLTPGISTTSAAVDALVPKAQAAADSHVMVNQSVENIQTARATGQLVTSTMLRDFARATDTHQSNIANLQDAASAQGVEVSTVSGNSKMFGFLAAAALALFVLR